MQQILLRISISTHEGAVERIARLLLSEKKANLLGLTGLDNRIHITHTESLQQFRCVTRVLHEIVFHVQKGMYMT